MTINGKLKPCAVLLKEFKEHNVKMRHVSTRLTFVGVGDLDVYNITAPFEDTGETVMAGRVEERDVEFSKVKFFRRTMVGKEEQWILIDDAPDLRLQDPFFTRINGELVLGGVELVTDPVDPGKVISWVTRFYRGRNLRNLTSFLVGPNHMKDIRLVELPTGSIGVFSRPQGERGGRGKIGFTVTESLDALTPELINAAPLFDDQFVPEEWGGANEPHLLANGLIGVLGHIAQFDANKGKHYYAMTFALDPISRFRTPLKIIAVRDNFEDGASKTPQLVDVIFSGGLVRLPKGKAALYAGVSDAQAHRIIIDDPFLEYENLQRHETRGE